MAARTPPELKKLEGLARRFGGGEGARKLALLRRVGSARLASASAVLRFHEVLLFLRAYPDDEPILREVERLLAAFERRQDLRYYRDELADSGLAGTTLHYAFYLSTAHWLARRYRGRLWIDWADFENKAALLEQLWILLTSAEECAAEELGYELPKWIRLLKRDDETDAEFLVQRLAALRAHPYVQETLWDALDVPLRIEPGPETPSRTKARFGGAAVTYQECPLDTRRPDLAAAIAQRPRSVRSVGTSEGRELIAMAREAMVTRSRDLDAFMHGDPRDVRLVEFDEGLQFAAIGTLPERRLLLEAVYGFLTLKNGVPIGYVLASGLNGSSEVAYNVFDTYRGGEAGPVYGHVLSMVHHLLGSTTFVVDPYQLGHGNEEGLASGAWWFYYKIGFRPLDPQIRRLVRSEKARMASNPSHRSSRETLTKLSADYMVYFGGPPRRDVLGLLDLGNISLGVARYLARRFGADRERGERTCAAEAAARLGLRSTKPFTPAERAAWKRWAPLLMVLPRVERWGAGARRDLAALVRAKGGRRESDYLRRLNAHRPLRRALLALADAEHE